MLHKMPVIGRKLDLDHLRFIDLPMEIIEMNATYELIVPLYCYIIFHRCQHEYIILNRTDIIQWCRPNTPDRSSVVECQIAEAFQALCDMGYVLFAPDIRSDTKIFPNKAKIAEVKNSGCGYVRNSDIKKLMSYVSNCTGKSVSFSLLASALGYLKNVQSEQMQCQRTDGCIIVADVDCFQKTINISRTTRVSLLRILEELEILAVIPVKNKKWAQKSYFALLDLQHADDVGYARANAQQLVDSICQPL